MANTINLVVAPQFVIEIVHEMGGVGGLTIVAGSASNGGGGGGSMTDAQVKAAYERNADTNVFDDLAEAKLGDIEDDATTDQTGAEIKTAYELEADTNAFDDAAVSKLAGISSGADVSPTPLTNSQIKTQYELNADTNAHTDAQVSKLAAIEASATADQTNAEIKTAYELNANTNAFTDAEKNSLGTMEDNSTADQTDAEIRTAVANATDSNVYTDDDEAKLGLIEAQATADQTDAQIRAAVEAATDSNVFNDADHSKLNAIEALADVTDAGNVAAAGAIMDGDIAAGEGFLRKTGTGTYEGIKSNLGATTNPLVTSDSAAGYAIGSRWINVTADTEYVCLDVSVGAAVWVETTAGASGGDPNPDQVSAQEMTDGTETALRSFSPDNIENMAQLHGGGGFPADPVITGHLSWLTDVKLWRDEAGVLAQRDGANNQRQRWYAWYTDADNGEWGEYGWTGGLFYLGSFANGTGVGRSMGFVTDGTLRWAINATGGFAPAFDNIHDIGLSGSNRPKDMFLAGTLSLLNVTANKSSMVISGYSLTGANAQNMVDLSGTWNTTGSPTVIYADMLDTASGAGTMLMDLKVGGVSMISVTKAGHVTAVSGLGGTMSDAEVKTAYENNNDTNAHTDAQVTKLSNIETAATADQTDGEIASAYGNQVGQISGSEIAAGTETALRTSSPADLKAIVDAHAPVTEINPFTDDHTLALTDINDIVEMDKATANVLLIPTNAAVAFPVNTVISISMMGAGITSITAAATVTLNGVSAGSGDMANKYDGVSLYKRGTNEWVVQGAIGAIS